MVYIDNADALKSQIDTLNRHVINDNGGDPEAIHQAVLKARNLAQQLNPPYALGYAHSLIAEARLAYQQANYDVVIERVGQVKAAYENLDVDTAYLRGLYLLGCTYHFLGQPTQALEAHQEQQRLANQISEKVWEASAFRRIGVTHDILGNLEVAQQYNYQSLALYEAAPDTGGVAGVLNNMSIIFRQQGKIREAIDYARRGLALFEEIGNEAGILEVHGQLALAYLENEDYDLALHHAQISLDKAKAQAWQNNIIDAQIRLGRVYGKMQNYEFAESMLVKALRLGQADDNLVSQAECLITLSQLYEQHGNFVLALDYHKQYHNMQIKIRDKATQSRFESLEVQHRTQQAQIEAQTERHLRQQDRLYFEKLSRMKDEVLSTASHDLKNPIASIMLLIYMLKKHGTTRDERGLDLLSRIEGSLSQMKNLITNLLDLARLETGKSIDVSRQDIVAVAREVYKHFELHAEASHINFHFFTNTESRISTFDPSAIQQVLSNLLSNALKFTPAGGSIHLHVQCADHETVIFVRDSGVGIPTGDIPRLFERFYRVNADSHQYAEGTGLGLAICKSIIEQHNGRIWLESKEGNGSTFYFSLPSHHQVHLTHTSPVETGKPTLTP